MFLLAALAVAGPVSLAVIFHGLRKAPEGYEDQDGFHFTRERPRYSGASVLPRRARSHRADGGTLDLPVPAGAGNFKS
jgi:hypothetical protein